MSGLEGDRGEGRIRALTDFVARSADPSLMAAVDALASEVMAALEAAQVRFLLLKGPALAQLLYRAGELRRYMDVDLLVDPAAEKVAADVLARAGFENLSAGAGVEDVAGVVHGESWRRPGGGLPVDLHWKLPGTTAAPEAAWPHLYEGRQTIAVCGRPTPVLGRPGLALHVAIHASQHGPSDLKAIADLERAVSRWGRADWESAAELAARVGAIDSLAAGLRLLPAGAEIAAELKLPEAARLTWSIENRERRPRGTFHLAVLSETRRPDEVVRLLRRALVPRREWIVREYPAAARSRPRLLLGYARHLARAPVWAIRAWRYRRDEARAGKPR